MKKPFAFKDLSEPMRRRVDLAIAVAQERLLSAHVEHALELIELVGEHVPFDTALDIYTRLLRLTDDESRAIATRALAVLGERAGGMAARTEAPEGAESTEERGLGARSFIQNVRQRLRGRVNEELRRWIELQAARTEVALLETHVENSLHFAELLEKELGFTEAVELYLNGLDVRESVADVTYFITLARLSDRYLPKRSARVDLRGEGSGSPSAEERRLRVMEGAGEASEARARSPAPATESEG